MLRNEEDPRHVHMTAVEAARLANQMERLGHMSIAAALDAAINNATNSKGESTTILHIKWEAQRGGTTSSSDTSYTASTSTPGIL